jgi:outer membrane lipoprotein-sorting protein
MISGVRRLLLAVLLASVSYLCHGETWNLQDLMQAMAQIPSSQARFVETRHIALLTRPVELKGSLSYERPHRLAKHVESPVDELLSVDGDALTVFNRTRGEQRVISLREQPAAGALVAAVRATLAGDLAQLERHYKADFEGSRAAWRLRLVPRDAQLKRLVESITLTGADTRVQRIESLETSGDRSLMTILHDGK